MSGLEQQSAPQVRVTCAGGDLSGVVRPGESWAEAARRTAAGLAGEPVALDLSGEEKLFVVDHDTTVTLRAMTRGDLTAVARWLAEEHVRRWWHQQGEPTLEAVSARYGPRIDGTSTTRMWVAEVNGRSIGFVQDYRVADHPDYALLTAAPAAIGVDYAIGEPDWVGRGHGVRLLWAWMLKARRRFPDAPTYFAAPDHRNTASLRMLQKAGFTTGLWFDEPQSDGSVSTVVGCSLDVATVIGLQVASPGDRP